jgi:hypothetical protein
MTQLQAVKRFLLVNHVLMIPDAQHNSWYLQVIPETVQILLSEELAHSLVVFAHQLLNHVLKIPDAHHISRN